MLTRKEGRHAQVALLLALSAALLAALAAGCGPGKTGDDNNNTNHQFSCGDGIVTLGELCDGANLNGQSCASIGGTFTGGVLACNSTCSDWVTTGCTGGTLCGNAQLDTGELCDGANLDGQTCTSIGGTFTGGVLACNSTCTGWDTMGCTGGALCGDAQVGGSELCDGANLDGQTCTSIGQGFTGGNLACNPTCDDWVTTGCTTTGSWTCDPTFYGGDDGCDCGCGIVDTDCANATVAACEYCNEEGSCNELGTGCENIDPTNNAVCHVLQCGDNLAQGAEVCDGADLRNESCATQGFLTGNLVCSSTCDALITTGCSGAPVCGNLIIEGAETCDGSSNLGGATCVSLGYEGGTLGCGLGCTVTTFNCTGWSCDPSYYGDSFCDCGCGIVDVDCLDDTSTSCEYCNNPGSCDPYGSDCTQITVTDNATCTSTTCGDGTAEGREQCDGVDLRAATCSSLGFPSGVLGCQPGCLYDVTACAAPTCGDGVIQGFEECEGTDLGDFAGALCTDLGFTGGSALTCTGCRIDMSGCTGEPAGWNCIPDFFGADDGCDCGCGIVDPDCTDATAASCNWCSGTGSCGNPTSLACPGTIDATNNASCQQ